MNGHAFGLAARRLLLLAAVALPAGGCAALLVGAAGGAAGTVYVLGKLQSEVSAPVPAVHRATLAGLEDLGLSAADERSDEITSHVEAHFADGKKVIVNSERQDASTTKITIRVGVFGDEDRSREILAAIKRHL